MDIIIPLEDVFPPIAKSSIAQEKSQPAEFQIFLMVPGYAVGHECPPILSRRRCQRTPA